MLHQIRVAAVAIVMGVLSSTSLLAQTVPAPVTTANQTITEDTGAIRAIAENTDAIRRELIRRYQNNPLFGELLLKNARIKGAAMRNQVDSIQRLVLELEMMIEEATFRELAASSANLARMLGQLAADVERLQSNQIVAQPGDANGPLDADFAPLRNASPTATTFASNDLNAPLIMGPDGQTNQLPPPPPNQVNSAVTPADPGQLVLPNLTLPTPDNTLPDFENRQTVQKPQLEAAPAPLQLLPPDGQLIDGPIPATVPRLVAPQPLNWGARPFHQPLRSLPIQVEFFSVQPSGFFGYQPYGGYYNLRGYGAGGRFCPGGW